MLLENKNTVIIGAGPVGLTMARLLQQQGLTVTVFERDQNATTRISGGTLDLHKGSGQDALAKAGLLDAYYEKSRPMGRTVADKNGNVLFSRPPSIEEQFDNPEINRNDLRTLLLNSLKDGTVIWDRKFSGLSVQNGKWVLQFENQPGVTADLVIGANGGMSKMRKWVNDAKIEYTGTLILQGEVSQPETSCPDFLKLCKDSILMAASEGSLVVANPKNGTILSYSVIFKKPENWKEENIEDTENGIAFLLNRLSGWAEAYKNLFRATSSFVVWPTRKIALEGCWKTNRPLPITLIGDAAHIMPPFAGQGVNSGLMDALILSENLTNGKFESIASALKDYEKQMFVYAKKAQSETHSNEMAMQRPDFSFLKF